MEKKENIRTAVILWLGTIGYMSLIFFLSSQTFSLPELPGNSDKFIHTMAYAPLAFLFYLSLSKSGMRKYVFAAALLLTLLYGIIDEIHQSFVPGRDAAVGDVAADFAGAVLGSFVARLFLIQKGWLPAFYDRN
ncbi:MAG: hypothetical protein C4538_12320 [Nitrospiraceae bacterium]|nr:MAG: hypothetical protein C4538_12320 [Nitrospiraceae bacterium]